MVNVQCLRCSNSFKISPSRIIKTKYCNRNCYSLDKIGKKANLSVEGREKKRLASIGNTHATGYKHTLEEIEKIREAGKKRVGMKFTEEHRKNISKAKIGVKYELRAGPIPPYRTLHYWLEFNFGKADRCENKDCIYPRNSRRGILMIKPGGYDWAKLRDKEYERKRENFTRLCKSCHLLYDHDTIDINL